MKGGNMTKNEAKVSVIIMTLNEEENIEQCLQSVYGWSDDVHIVDSNSADHTIDIAKKYTNNIHTIKEAHFSNIRNWVFSTIPLKYEWILFVDADEWLTEELKNEIIQKINSDIEEIGFRVPRRFIFLNKWLKHGGMYYAEARLYKRGKIHYIPDGDVECAIFEGKSGILENYMVHQDLKPFSTWIDKHNTYSLRAAKRYMDERIGEIDNAITRRSQLKKIGDKVPLLLRPFLMFFYIYFIKLGFLDGKEGLIYHLHHAFWYQLLIYTKVKEMEIRQVKELKDKR